MKLVTVQASAIKSTFEVLKEILNDINLKFDNTGLNLMTLDTARTALVHLCLNASNFETYECEEEIEAGINLTNTFKLLKSITTNDTLKIEINSKEYMNININNESKKTKTHFDLKLLDINEQKMSSPKVDIALTTILSSVDFQRLCRDMSNIGENMLIHRYENKIVFSVQGDFANQSTELETDYTDLDFKGLYSLKYLNYFTKATSMCSNVYLMQEVNNKFLILKYDVANLGEVKFYLAVKVEE